MALCYNFWGLSLVQLFQAVSEQSLSFKLGLVSEISSDRKVFAFYEDRDLPRSGLIRAQKAKTAVLLFYRRWTP